MLIGDDNVMKWRDSVGILTYRWILRTSINHLVFVSLFIFIFIFNFNFHRRNNNQKGYTISIYLRDI